MVESDVLLTIAEVAVAFAGFASLVGVLGQRSSHDDPRVLGTRMRAMILFSMMLIHGARSALRAGMMTDEPDDLRAWALDLKRRKGFNLAAVALANKLARIAWRVWNDERDFEPRRAA